MSLLTIKNLNRGYAGGHHLFQDFSLSLEGGDFCFLSGKSGSGKTSLIKLLLGQLNSPQGTIFFEGSDISTYSKKQIQSYRKQIGVIFQDFRLVEWKNVRENLNISSDIDTLKIEQIMKSLGIDAFADDMPQTLSGGEKQRVAIGRALARSPKILFADEPTGNLDRETAQTIAQIMLDQHATGQTVLCITHNQQLIDRISERVKTKVVKL